MKKILVIEREYGAGAGAIAEETARRLGWKLYDHALTEEIAAMARVQPEQCSRHEERVDPWIYRLAKVFWRGSHERSMQLGDADVLDADMLIKVTQAVVEKLAATGNCVIVGRAAAFFLRDRPDTYCVFLYAPRENRYQRILADLKDEAKALESVDSVDNERRQFIQHYFGAEWPSRQLYHSMLNTAIGEEATVDLILHLMKDAERREETAGK